MTLFGCLSFDFIILVINVLGRTRALIVYLRMKSVNKKQFNYTIPLPEKVNLGLFFHFEINYSTWVGGTLRYESDFTIVEQWYNN